MNEQQFEQEKLYQATMAIARSMLKKGIISKEEYTEFDTKMQAKYSPQIGTLCSDIDLITS